MRSNRLFMLVLLTRLGAAVSAQLSLESLWPNDDGLRWEFTYTLIDHIDETTFTTAAFLRLAGTASTPGSLAQILHTDHASPPARANPEESGVTRSGQPWSSGTAEGLGKAASRYHRNRTIRAVVAPADRKGVG